MTAAPSGDPLTVLLLIHGLHMGGAESSVRHLAAGLRDAGVNPIVCAWRNDGALRADLENDGIKVIAPLINGSGWRKAMVPGRLARLLRRQRIDLIHAHMSDSAAWSMLAGGLARRPFVITHHSANLIDNAFPPGSLAAAGRHALLARCAKRAKLNIAVSGTVQGILQDHVSLDPDRVAVIPNGVPLPAQSAMREAVKQRWARASQGFTSGRRGPVILYLGRMARVKGTDLLVDAAPSLAKRLPHCRVVMVGAGPDSDALEKRVAAEGLGTVVEMPGKVSDVSGWLKQADLVVLPSRVEGMPMVMLEAMSWGVPVVATSIPANAELLRGGERGTLCPPEDPGALADAIVTALEAAPHDTETRVDRSLEALQQFYSIAAVADVHVQAYRRILEV